MAIRNLAIMAAVVALMLPDGAQGQGQGIDMRHLKKANPNELYVIYTQHDSCAGMYEQVVDNELAQARIKRMPFMPYNEITLDVIIDCLTMSDGIRQVYTISVRFGEILLNQDEDTITVRHYIGGHQGTFGISSDAEEKITNTLRTLVEDALADYLKENFDL